MSFLSALSWLSRLRVPQHGLPPLSRGRSPAEALDSRSVQILPHAPASVLGPLQQTYTHPSLL